LLQCAFGRSDPNDFVQPGGCLLHVHRLQLHVRSFRPERSHPTGRVPSARPRLQFCVRSFRPERLRSTGRVPAARPHSQLSVRSFRPERLRFALGGCLLHVRLATHRSAARAIRRTANRRAPFNFLSAVRTIVRQLCPFVRPAGRTATRTTLRLLSADTTVQSPICALRTVEPGVLPLNDPRPSPICLNDSFSLPPNSLDDTRSVVCPNDPNCLFATRFYLPAAALNADSRTPSPDLSSPNQDLSPRPVLPPTFSIPICFLR